PAPPRGRTTPPAPAPPPPPPPPPSPPSEPPPVTPPTFHEPTTPTVVVTPEHAGAAGARPFDLSAAAGATFWSKGLSRTADPSFEFVLAGGYTFMGSPESAMHFRLGGVF